MPRALPGWLQTVGLPCGTLHLRCRCQPDMLLCQPDMLLRTLRPEAGAAAVHPPTASGPTCLPAGAHAAAARGGARGPHHLPLPRAGPPDVRHCAGVHRRPESRWVLKAGGRPVRPSPCLLSCKPMHVKACWAAGASSPANSANQRCPCPHPLSTADGWPELRTLLAIGGVDMKAQVGPRQPQPSSVMPHACSLGLACGMLL